jgi:hypothetical protein
MTKWRVLGHNALDQPPLHTYKMKDIGKKISKAFRDETMTSDSI